MKLPYKVLILDDDENALVGLEELVRSLGHEVTTSSSYEDARTLLTAGSYDLLITDVRLRGFNGLHLVMKVRDQSSDMAVMIMTGYDDSLMELEARRYNAEFIRKPFKAEAFLELVTTSLAGVRRQRRWPRKQVLGGFRVKAAGLPAAVVDVCYGGLRLEMPHAGALPRVFAVELSGIGLHLEVQPVWSANGTNGGLVCGAAIASETSHAARTWRTIVDRLNA